MSIEQIELTLHDVFDHMELNNHLRELARKASKNYVMKKGFSLTVADQVVEHIFH